MERNDRKIVGLDIEQKTNTRSEWLAGGEQRRKEFQKQIDKIKTKKKKTEFKIQM